MPRAVEENVAVAVDGVPGSDHAIHVERPAQVDVEFNDFQGVYLQGVAGGSRVVGNTRRGGRE